LATRQRHSGFRANLLELAFEIDRQAASPQNSLAGGSMTLEHDKADFT
jgi:hypothetical protein